MTKSVAKGLCLELLFERAHIEFLCPRTGVLVSEMPISLGNRRRLEQILVFRVGKALANKRHVDWSVHIDVGHVNPLRSQVAREHLREPAQGKFRRTKRGRGRERLDPG